MRNYFYMYLGGDRLAESNSCGIYVSAADIVLRKDEYFKFYDFKPIIHKIVDEKLYKTMMRLEIESMILDDFYRFKKEAVEDTRYTENLFIDVSLSDACDPDRRIVTNVNATYLPSLHMYRIDYTSSYMGKGHAEETELLTYAYSRTTGCELVGLIQQKAIARYQSEEYKLTLIEEIMDKLDASGEDVLFPQTHKSDSRYFKSSAVVDILETLCCDTLINSKGGCKWANIKKLRGRGFDIFAGEKDSYGWVRGCLKSKKGSIVSYG